jgi:hypothetical protein
MPGKPACFGIPNWNNKAISASSSSLFVISPRAESVADIGFL